MVKRGEVMNCIVCRMPTRPARTKVKDWPGTRERYGNRCSTCHRHATPEDVPPRMSLNEMRSGLAAFIRARRTREAAMSRREFVAYHHLNQQETA